MSPPRAPTLRRALVGALLIWPLSACTGEVWTSTPDAATIKADAADTPADSSPGDPGIADGATADAAAPDGPGIDAPLGPATSLRGAGARAGRLMGAAVAAGPLRSDGAYGDLLASEISYFTPENATKWGPLQPASDRWDFDDADAIIDFAEAHGQAIKGHALVWHNQTPSWVGDHMSADELRAAMRSHIAATVTRYRGRIAAWDVVNEAVEGDGSLRQTIFLQKLGPSYIDDAFHWAHEADPDAILLYNDFSIEAENAKSDRVLELVTELLDRGVPIHGVGFQSHFDARYAPSADELSANLRRFTGLGLEVNLSEIDVRIREVAGSTEEKLHRQAQVYHDAVAGCLAVERCTAITFWGITDRYSWIDSFFGEDDPLPFDESYSPKPAVAAILAALRGEPRP